MFINIGRQELLNIPHLYAASQPSVLSKIKSGMYTLKNRDDDRVAASAEIGLTFFNQQRAGHGRTMDNRAADDKITVAIRGTVSHRRSMDFKRIFRHNQTELRRYKVLQHSTEILRAWILLLALFRLLKQFVQICADRFGSIGG